jgi:methyl-accepting chemotaxis protein
MSDNQEYVLSEHDLIMSYTDKNGIITSVNDDLLRITGYTKEELIGKSHNVIRHPDMPKQVYADLWKTLAKKHTWTGLIKNKRKNGGFYWIRASITPMFQREAVIGYIAVHRNACEKEIKEISQIYDLMRAGTFKGDIIAGNIVAGDFVSKYKRKFSDIKITHKIQGLALFMSLAFVLVGSVDYLNINQLDNVFSNTIQNFKNTSQNVLLARKARMELKASVQEWQNILIHGQNAHDFESYKNAFFNGNKNVVQNLENLKNTLIQQQKSTEQVDHVLADHNESFIKYNNALKNYQNTDESMHAIDSITKNVSKDEIEDFNFLVESFEKELNDQISNAEMKTENVIFEEKVYIFCAVFFLLSVTFGFLWLLLQDIVKPLEYAKEKLRAISMGHYLQPVETILQNEVGEMLDVMKAMSVRLGSVIDMEKKASNEHLAVLIGLDSVTTGVMITDTSREIIYVNKAAQVLLKDSESYIKEAFPKFSAAKIVGENIDIFHKNPAHQIAILDNVTETTEFNIIVGSRNIQLKVSPIINQFGHRLGDVVEWDDLTTRIKIENEISAIVNEAINGRFTGRFEAQNHLGFYKTITDDLNTLLEVCESGFDDFKRVFSNMVQGDLTEKIEKQYKGDFDILTQDANLAVLQLNTVVFDLNNAIDKVNYTIQDINDGNNNLANRTQVQTENVQQTVSAISSLKTAVDQNDEAAKYANQAVNRVFDVANKGVKVIHNVVSTMEEIHASSLKVGDIISVIDGIAFQTNILALNAAVEAARAGDQGRGFAVVASEVRNLAQLAAGAAKEIKGLITDSEEKIESGGEFVGNAGKIMQEIASSIENVTAMMAKISQSCSEQSLAIDQVNSAIMETENIVKQNADLVVAAANSSASLEEEMKTLAEKTAYFKVQKNVVDFQLF